jgi:aryl-alcohol dehydrogenase (NADP+)
MTFGGQCDEAQSFAIMDAATEGGIDFFDTSNSYPVAGGQATFGTTETIVGKWLSQGRRRQDVILATKGMANSGDKPWQGGASRKNLLDAIELSLKRLQTDYVDLYQVHQTDPDTPIEETVEALDTIVRQGKARYVGVSNWLAHRVARALGRSEAKGLTRIASVQPRYNLLFRNFERDLLPMCQEEGVAVIPYNPIAGGLLSGKHVQAEAATGTRFGSGPAAPSYRDRYWHDAEFETVEALKGVAAEAGRSLPSLAVGWVLANPAITAPIVGASRPEQLKDSLHALANPLPAELKTRLDDLTRRWRAVDADR